ncbi:MAG: hypothetical protein UX02_C0002G0071 [Candidatus Moranbacteria bacterium GW2011_GWC1_45_18]|nr:MAG: hypothetical protein UT79_C0001G0390 [Candidatus Moranbacteria bacterium GW2011_GWC2_40_12]KKT32372.1 MAG: hypothetical protein UW19_C0023G0026 [Candidatus Moranbacteria bacterium GW2011_GWF2_44_10]KKT99752.1 MAG: hypothetical protein UX02_C0002G0071 [Candidatus Moranbacteria bacterium GW2011_GWC1_45_18]
MIPIGVIALVSAAGVAYAAYAYQGDPAQKGPNFSVERHEAMQKAFENNDYNAWKSLMNGRGRVTEAINEGNFAKFSEMHRLMLDGKYDEANQIREELGLRGQNRNQTRDGDHNCPGGGKYLKSGNGIRGNSQS